jgi:DMSO/TMAO reductase YedYZ molybdopterin-dependent catalytic subunit
MSAHDDRLPPGQRWRDDFPRFGMTVFASRFPARPDELRLQWTGALREPLVLDAAALAGLPRVEQRSDFHCVTSWSRRDLLWSGHRFADVYEALVRPLAAPQVSHVVLRGEDGYRADLPLADLMASEVLLADRLDGAPLGLAHGAPLRLVAPAHYGYKNVKHLQRIELRESREGYRPLGPAFMSHERGRVALEERGHHLPGWLLRHLFRPFIGPTVATFARALRERERR